MEIEIRGGEGRGREGVDARAAGGILNRTRKIHPMPVLLSHTP